MSVRSDAIRRHYSIIWKSEPVVVLWPDHALRVKQLPAGFHVLRFERPGDLWVYATVNMSIADDEEALELHMLCNRREDECAMLLTVSAYFHRSRARLSSGHGVNFGQAWCKGSRCSYGLVSLPYIGGPNWENCTTRGEAIRCLWLLPITPEEASFKRKDGLEALEQKFESSVFNYADPLRRSVV